MTLAGVTESLQTPGDLGESSVSTFLYAEQSYFQLFLIGGECSLPIMFQVIFTCQRLCKICHFDGYVSVYVYQIIKL